MNAQARVTTHLAAGLDFGVVRRADGTLRAWGRNDAGQLGASSSGDCGGTACSLTPLTVAGLSGAATAVAGGFGHSLTSTVAVGLTGGTTTYAYDKLSRLTGVTAPTGTTTYAYDPVGNRTSRTRTGTTNITYTYDRADRIKTVVQGSSTTYTMNANGNLSARGNDDFTYDQANRLKTAVVGGVTSSYAYDGDGKRVSQTVAGVTTRSVYDVGGGLPVLLDDGSRKYVWGLGLAYAVTSGGAVEVVHADGLGSVRALTDGAGALVQTQATDEFGVPTGTLGSSSQPFGYTGEQRDGATGLVYLRARMYDPATGRFVQRDPWPGAAANPLSLHRYAYVANNPVNATDPSGLDSMIKDDVLCMPRSIIDWLLYGSLCRPQDESRGQSLANSGCKAFSVFIGLALPCLRAGPLASSPGDGGRGLTTKDAARRVVSQMGLPPDQAATILKTIARATATSVIDIVRREGDKVIVTTSRQGRHGYQAIETVIRADGTRESVIQRAYDASGNLVHFDPKLIP